MRHSKLSVKILFLLVLLVLLFSTIGYTPITAQQADSTTTSTGAYITVTFEDGANVRSGPNTAYYPILIHLNPGQTAPAVGRTPGSEWIQIYYPGIPGEVGWVYAAYVSLTGGLPPIVPTPLPPPSSLPTFDPALATALAPAATLTRLPTFTPPPPLVIPTFITQTAPVSKTPMGIIVIALIVIGVFGVLISFLRGR